MKRLLISPVLLILFYSASFAGSKPTLKSGPMQGQTTAHETMLWIMVRNAHKTTLTIKNTKTGKEMQQEQSTAGIQDWHKNVPLTFDFKGLDAGTEYEVTIQLDGQTVQTGRKVHTYAEHPGDFSFIEGSCAYLPPKGFRWMQPGNGEHIYKYMIKTPGDFMMWTGDYLYFWYWHYKSCQGMMKKYVNTREHPLMEKFVESRPEYCIWDDHDYGPNNSLKSWVRKECAMDLYKKFWPQKSYGTDSVRGIFYNFTYSDAEFFMTDDRWYRDAETVPHPEMLGKEQLNWLEQRVLASKAVFKFIVVGSQTLNTVNNDECFAHFKEELGNLLDFIHNNHISGVVFLTGDVHFTELTKRNRANDYPLYDFTSSAISSLRYKVTRFNSPMKHNPDRVPGTLYDNQNYGRVSVTGPTGNRVCTLETYSNRGKLVWKYEINEKELQAH